MFARFLAWLSDREMIAFIVGSDNDIRCKTTYVDTELGRRAWSRNRTDFSLPSSGRMK
jgi:hypothetical protein